jgi:hypothetical protein
VFDPERLKPIIESLGEKLIPIAAAYSLRTGSRRSHKNGGMDRGCAKYELFNRIVEAGTSRTTAEAARAAKNNDLSSRGTLSASPTAVHDARIK